MWTYCKYVLSCEHLWNYKLELKEKQEKGCLVVVGSDILLQRIYWIYTERKNLKD